jgi:Ku70/Ku80 beta-barrel domain
VVLTLRPGIQTEREVSLAALMASDSEPPAPDGAAKAQSPAKTKANTKSTKDNPHAIIYVMDASAGSDAAAIQDGPSSSSSSSGTSPPTAAFEAAKRAVLHGVLDHLRKGTGGVEVIVCRSDCRHHKENDDEKEEDDDEDENEDDDEWWNSSLTRLNTDDRRRVGGGDNDRGGQGGGTAGLRPASPGLLRKVREEFLPSRAPSSALANHDPTRGRRRGTVLHGLYWATRLLWERHRTNPLLRTGGAKAAATSRIVVLVDGSRSRLAWPRDRIDDMTTRMLDEMNHAGCLVRVVYMEMDGSGSTRNSEPGPAYAASSSGDPPDDMGGGAGDEREVDVDDATGSEEESEDGDDAVWTSQYDRLELFSVLTKQATTGSDRVVARSFQEVLAATTELDPAAPSPPRATHKNVELWVTRDLVIQAAHAPMAGTKVSLPTVKNDKVLLVDEGGKIMVDEETGEPLTDTVYREKIRHVGGEVIDPRDVSRVISFCRDRIPMSREDYLYAFRNDESLFLEKPRYELLGFMEASRIPEAFLAGPAKVLGGNAGAHKSQAMLAALAQALEGQGKVAICTFTSQGSAAKPKQTLGALYPMGHIRHGAMPESKPTSEMLDIVSTPTQLMFLRLPFEGEVKDTSLSGAVPDRSRQVGWDESQACDNMIDTMRLNTGELEPESVPSPALRCWSQTLVQRFANPNNDDVVTDPIRPPHVEESKDALDQFWSKFTLPTIDAKRKAESLLQGTKNDKGSKRKRALYYKDWL